MKDKESLHYKCGEDLFRKMINISYPQKFTHICNDHDLPPEWSPENINEGVFIHGEDEDDIKDLLEKLKFKDEEREEFEKYYNETSFETKDKEEILFEVMFRKGAKNYSYLNKVVYSFQDFFKNAFKNKVKVVERLFKMFSHNPERMFAYFDVLTSEDFEIIQYDHIFEYIYKWQNINATHIYLLRYTIIQCFEEELVEKALIGTLIYTVLIDRLKEGSQIDIHAVIITYFHLII